MSFAAFFSSLQESPWYRQFLNPVLDEVNSKGTLLDIGTGSGKMVQILADEKGMICTGVDTNEEMLIEAKDKLKHTKVKLLKINPSEKLPFSDKKFDYVTICSVLFHLKTADIDLIIADALRLLKENGKILILTPTGGSNVFQLTRHFYSYKNKGIYIWYKSTKKRAKLWTSENYLASYSSQNQLKYNRKIVLNGFAQLEIIENK